MKELALTVQTRVEDLLTLQRSVEATSYRAKRARVDVFEELKNSEIARLVKENNLYQSLAGLKPT